MKKRLLQIQKNAGSMLILTAFCCLLAFIPGRAAAQNTPKIKVSKKSNTQYGEGGFEKSFLRRNVEIKLIHDKYNIPREEVKKFTYTGGNSKINTWYFDNKYQLNHFSSNYYNASKVKIGTVTAYYKNNKLQDAYGEYLQNGESKTEI